MYSHLAAGRMVVLREDDKWGGEGDLLIAAEFAGPEAINFMAGAARGLVCLALTPRRCEELGLEPIEKHSTDSPLGAAAMVSIEARDGVTTGISAADRARTIAVAVDPASRPEDLLVPGHVFPLRARAGGVLEFEGRIEAAVDLVAGAGLSGAAVLCQILRDDGEVAKGPDLDRFAARHGLATVTVSDVARRRLAAEPGMASRVAETGQTMRDVMGHFATGVSVVTARDADGGPVGTTANAISSVSLDPPLLLACLARRSETLMAIRVENRFGVNILAAEQRLHSDRFAAKGLAARAHEVEFDEHELGVPILPGALATIVCKVEAIHPAGDHDIVVGLAHHLERGAADARPLLFYRGSYSQIRIEEDELAA
jgi:3,4-dihydroxy-2-butanone 4-phosphate synthase